MVVLGPAVAVGMALDANGGSIAEWVAAIAATIGLFAAIAAARIAYGTFQRELDKDDRQQAEKVSAWAAEPMEWLTDGVQDYPLGGHVPSNAWLQLRGVDVRIRNASELPITWVHVKAMVVIDHDQPAEDFGSLPRIPVVAPGTEPEERQIMADTPVDTPRFVDLNTTRLNRVVLRMRFTDAAGVEWVRTIPGTLKRAAED